MSTEYGEIAFDKHKNPQQQIHTYGNVMQSGKRTSSATIKWKLCVFALKCNGDTLLAPSDRLRWIFFLLFGHVRCTRMHCCFCISHSTLAVPTIRKFRHGGDTEMHLLYIAYDYDWYLCLCATATDFMTTSEVMLQWMIDCENSRRWGESK